MSSEENKARIRRFYEALNRKHYAVYDELVAADFAYNGAQVGREGMRQFSMMARSAFPDLWHRIETQVAEGDLVATHYTWGGTMHGEWNGPEGRFAPTGKTFTASGLDLCRIHDGMLVEGWGVADRLDIQQQLGLLPVPAHSDAVTPH